MSTIILPIESICWNEYGRAKCIESSGLGNCRRVRCCTGISFLLHEKSKVLTKGGIKYVENLTTNDSLPCTIQPSLSFIGGGSETFSISDTDLTFCVSDAKAFQFMQLLGVLSHAKAMNLQFLSIVPDVYDSTLDVVHFATHVGLLRFASCCKYVFNVEVNTKTALLSVEHTHQFQTPTVFIAEVPSILRRAWTNFSSEELPSRLNNLPSNLVYAWLTGRLDSTLHLSSSSNDEISYFTSNEGGHNICILFPANWDPLLTQSLLHKLSLATDIVDGRVILGDKRDTLFGGLTWMAMAMPFYFNSLAALAWSEAVLSKRMESSLLTIESIEEVNQYPTGRFSCIHQMYITASSPKRPAVSLCILI